MNGSVDIAIYAGVHLINQLYDSIGFLGSCPIVKIDKRLTVYTLG
ncbi:hypothetical protein SDC9_105634 [bioreactor metagenome]|uniref:Uncharacterized protein n=1 Tax=bioreactor metagenome TaxID=1076179 RepID=A0A645B2M0_9ZZZZ